MATPTIAAPVNLYRPAPAWRGEGAGQGEYLYRYGMTKSGRFQVWAIYTGLPTGCIGSAGKSFATAAERDAATLASCERLLRSKGNHGWTLVTVEG